MVKCSSVAMCTKESMPILSTVQVFHFDGEWTQRGTSLQGGQSVSIDLSYDGKNILIGSKEFSDGGSFDNGRVAYYRWGKITLNLRIKLLVCIYFK